jgi:hypothetical protein
LEDGYIASCKIIIPIGWCPVFIFLCATSENTEVATENFKPADLFNAAGGKRGVRNKLKTKDPFVEWP